jgi:hypothetical protein
VERLEGLLDRCLGVPAVDLVQVDVVGPETREAVVDLGHDRLAGQAAPVGPAGVHVPVDLRGDDDLVAAGVLLQRLPDDLLARPGGVDVRGVEEVDAELDGLLDQRPAVLLAEGPRMAASVGFAERHAAEADAGHVEAGAAELHVLHASRPYGRALRFGAGAAAPVD